MKHCSVWLLDKYTGHKHWLNEHKHCYYTNTVLTLEISQKWLFTLWPPRPHRCTETCKCFGKSCQTPPCDYPGHVPTECTFFGPRSCSKYRKMPVSCCTRSVNACLGCAGVCTLSDTDGTLTDRPSWLVALPPLQSTPKTSNQSNTLPRTQECRQTKKKNQQAKLKQLTTTLRDVYCAGAPVIFVCSRNGCHSGNIATVLIGRIRYVDVCADLLFSCTISCSMRIRTDSLLKQFSLMSKLINYN